MVAHALAHLDLAVRTRQTLAHDDRNQRRLAERLLQLAPRHHDVEELILPADLHVGLHRAGVVSLHQRVKHLVQVDRLAFFQAAREVVPRQELLHGEILRQPDNVAEIQLGQPFVITAHNGLGRIENLERLRLVGPRVFLDFVRRELSPGLFHVRRIADQARERPDQEGDLVAEVLKMA